jgi:hypothetical protein
MTCFDYRVACTHELQQIGGEINSCKADRSREQRADPDGLAGNAGCSVMIFRAYAARDDRGDTHPEADGDGVNDGDERFCESHCSDGIGAESRDEDDVRQCKDRFHRHLEHHRNRKQSEGAADRPDCEIGLVVADGLAKEVSHAPCKRRRSPWNPVSHSTILAISPPPAVR